MWDRFEGLMKAKRLRIADVARETGISYSTFTDWKAGRYHPKADKIQKLADFFNVSYEYIIGKSNKKNESEHKSTLKENILRGYMRAAAKGKEYPIYIEDEDGNRIMKAKVVTEGSLENTKSAHLEIESTTENPNDAFYDSLTDEQKEEITRLYQLYQKADPAHRLAVEALLGAKQ